jgi:hypothetical protein
VPASSGSWRRASRSSSRPITRTTSWSAGGFFSDSARLRVSEAWEFFGEANGVATVEEMRERIGRYRRASIGPGEDPVIGCLFVRDVRFFPAGAIADPPPQFARNIVQGKSYDLADRPTCRSPHPGRPNLRRAHGAQ